MIEGNVFMVGSSVGSGGVVILNTPRRGLSRDEALNLAAWLVAVAGDTDLTDFRAAYEAAVSS